MSQPTPSHAGGIPLTMVPPPADLVPGLVQWRIILARRGKQFLYLLVLDEGLAGSDVMRRVMELYRTETISLASRTRHLLHTLVAEVAELEWVCLLPAPQPPTLPEDRNAPPPHTLPPSSVAGCSFLSLTRQAPDVEAQYYPQRVALISSSRHRGLTEACRDPAALASASGFAALHPEFIVPAGGLGAGARFSGTGADCAKAILVHAQVTGTSDVRSVRVAAGRSTGGIQARPD